jgi:uncharacterized protein (TIRG00374 family)
MMRGSVSWLLPWLLRLIGPALLVVFLANSDLHQLIAILQGAHPTLIILSLLLIFPFLLVKGWRWKRIMHELAIDIPYRTATGLYMVGIYLGSITPGQAGDLAKAWYLRSRGHPLAPALMSVVLDRLFDLVIMAALATLGVFALGPLLPNRAHQTIMVIVLSAGVVFVLTALTMRRLRQWLLSRVVSPLMPERLRGSLERWNEQLVTLAMHPRLIIPSAVASLISAGFTFFRLWLLFLALNIHIPFHVVVGVSALIAILQVLPISIAGMGIRDAILIGVLLSYNYSTEQALSLSALFLLLTVEQTLAGFVVSFWYPIGQTLRREPTDQEAVSETIPE